MFGKSKSPKPVPTLPTELVEMIIGYMPSDAFSLSQRCLVCKDWRQRFQPALFAHILLIDADEAEAFRTAVQSSHELGLCAQTIKITCRPQSYKGRFWLDKYYEMGTTWGLCTNIKTLILSEVSLMITPRKPLDVRAFHHVKRLELSSVMVSKLNGLNLVLSQLTVESLLLESVYVNDSSVSLPAPDSVRDIELCQLYASSSINDAASWQEYGRALAVLFPYVTTVAVQVNNGGDEVTVRQWVERMDQRLERLTLRVSSGAENDIIGPVFSLSRAIHLRSLAFQIYSSPQNDYVSKILPSISSGVLEEVSIELRIAEHHTSKARAFGKLDWPLIDEQLSNFASLKTVTVRANCVNVRNDGLYTLPTRWKNAIRKTCPRLHEQGILRVEASASASS